MKLLAYQCVLLLFMGWLLGVATVFLASQYLDTFWMMKALFKPRAISASDRKLCSFAYRTYGTKVSEICQLPFGHEGECSNRPK